MHDKIWVTSGAAKYLIDNLLNQIKAAQQRYHENPLTKLYYKNWIFTY